jgi:predicted ATPase/class 3 adenylate cyclase
LAELPTGTVTFLFTDIEGSTRLWEEQPEAMRLALARHDALLREAIEQYGGVVFKTVGDAFCAAFATAPAAVRSALAAQLALASEPWPGPITLRVRMALHTGVAEIRDADYFGPPLNLVARLLASGHGGQTLLSKATEELARNSLAPGLRLRDLGEHRLRDLTQPQQLFEVLPPSLLCDFPPLRTLENRPTNLPIQATPFVGRGREFAALCELVRREDARLVTLTGPGGMGKTRLALQAAAELVEEFPNGVFFVALAAITNPDLLLPTVAQTLGVSEAAGQSLSGYLAMKRLLLVLDNFEQVVTAAPHVGQLLAQAPQVKVLVTSREPLQLAAERVFPVPPLTLPDPRRLPELTSLSQYEAVRLFVERAQAVQPSFAVTTANAPAVAELCARLDGLPLALELAAARSALLSPEAMLKRLDDRLKLLTSGARDLPARQQTLRNTLTWSFDLLQEQEQRLFTRLGVFAGGFTLEAAEAVCDADLDTLASLVHKSLVRRDDERFDMLESIREYARERLASGSDWDVARGCHATYFEELAERTYSERFRREKEGLDELEREHDNLRAALDWLKKTDARRYLQLAGGLGWFWHLRSHFSEGRARLAEAITGTSDQDEVRARALTAAGELAAWAGDLVAAQPLIEEAVSIWRELGRDQDAALALHELGWGYFYANDDPAARRYMEESLALQRSVGDPFLVNRAQIGLLQVLVSIGELETVELMSQEALELARRLNDLRSEHFAVHFLADCALIRGDYVTAEQRYIRSLELAVEIGDRSETAVEIQGLAMSASGQSRPRRALQLAGAAAAEFDALGIDLSGIRFWSELLAHFIGRARAELGTDAAAAWQEGRAMILEQAVAYALGADPTAG